MAYEGRSNAGLKVKLALEEADRRFRRRAVVVIAVIIAAAYIISRV